MADTQHRVLVKFEADTKGVEAGTRRIAKEANKLSKQQKLEFAQNFKNQKATAKIAGPQQQRQLTTELKRQNQEHRTTNRLLQMMAAGWQRVATAAKSAWKATEGSGRGRGGRGGGGGGTGFGAGWRAGMGPGPNFSRYGLGHGLASGARAGLGLAALGLGGLAHMPISAVSSDYQAYFTHMRSMGSLSGLNKGARFGAGLTKGGVDDLTRRMTEFGYAPEETVNASRLFARSTGTGAYTEKGMTAAKVLGLEASDVSSMFGELRRAGGGFGEKGMKDFQRLLQAAVKGGVDASTLPEYLEGLQHLTGRAGGAAGGAVSALPYAQLLAMFEKSGAAGLKGARGASVLSALEEGFKSPGGGDEGLAVIMGSLGFGRAGGNTSYYSAKKMMEQGFSGPGGAGNLKNLFDYVDRITGGGEEANLYMEGLMGGRLTLDQIEKVRGSFESGGTSEEISAMLADMTATELDVLHSIDDHMKEFLGASKRAADVAVDDITRGEAYSKSVQSIEDMMHEFLMTTMPVMVTTLEGVNNTLKFIMPGIEKMVNMLTDKEVGSVIAGEDLRKGMGEAWTAETTARSIMKRAEGGGEVSDEELQSVIAESLSARNAIRDYYSNPDFLTSMAEMIQEGAVGAGVMERTDVDRDTARMREDFSRAVAALDQLAERMGRGSEVTPERITNDRELTAAMTALGIAIPAGPRSRVDTTGGSP